MTQAVPREISRDDRVREPTPKNYARFISFLARPVRIASEVVRSSKRQNLVKLNFQVGVSKVDLYRQNRKRVIYFDHKLTRLTFDSGRGKGSLTSSGDINACFWF